MENAGYVFAAFAVIWALVFGFLLFFVSRQRKLRQEIDSLRETIKEKEIGQ
jgi:CcmD family protein